MAFPSMAMRLSWSITSIVFRWSGYPESSRSKRAVAMQRLNCEKWQRDMAGPYWLQLLSRWRALPKNPALLVWRISLAMSECLIQQIGCTWSQRIASLPGSVAVSICLFTHSKTEQARPGSSRCNSGVNAFIQPLSEKSTFMVWVRWTWHESGRQRSFDDISTGVGHHGRAGCHYRCSGWAGSGDEDRRWPDGWLASLGGSGGCRSCWDCDHCPGWLSGYSSNCAFGKFTRCGSRLWSYRRDRATLGINDRRHWLLAYAEGGFCCGCQCIAGWKRRRLRCVDRNRRDHFWNVANYRRGSCRCGIFWCL